MEEYRNKFIDLFEEWRKRLGLTSSTSEGWSEISITVSYKGSNVVSIHEKADRPLRLEPWYEDDHEEAMNLRNIAYFKAYGMLKEFIKNIGGAYG